MMLTVYMLCTGSEVQGTSFDVTFAIPTTNSDPEVSKYTTVVPYLLINNLEPEMTYTFRVAAYTVGGKGPFQS